MITLKRIWDELLVGGDSLLAPGGCLQLHIKGPKVQLLAERQSTWHSQAPRARQKFKPPVGWTHFHSKMHLEQAVSGCQQPPGTRWSLQLHFRGPKFKLLAESQPSKHSQAPCTRQRFKPPMAWTHDHS